MKRTYQPGKKSKHTTHGFRKRMTKKGGQKVIKARRAKGRHRLSVKTPRKGHYK